jgi:hypothetical protein
MPQGSFSYVAAGNYPITHFPLGPGSFVGPALGGSPARMLQAPTAPAYITINGNRVIVNLLQDDANSVLQKLRTAGIPAHIDSHGRLVLDIPTGSPISGDLTTLQALGLA